MVWFSGRGDDALPVVTPFDRVAFRVDSATAQHCALLAATDVARQQGMQRMRNLRGYDAMIFSFDEDATASFINHYVPIDLAIGWFDADGRLVDQTVMEKCPSGDNCPLYTSKAPYRYAVETPAGGLTALGLANAGATLHVGGSCG